MEHDDIQQRCVKNIYTAFFMTRTHEVTSIVLIIGNKRKTSLTRFRKTWTQLYISDELTCRTSLKCNITTT